MNLPIELSLCIVAWTLTLARFRAIQWKDIRKDNGIALHVWLTMVFFSTTSIFLIKETRRFLRRLYLQQPRQAVHLLLNSREHDLWHDCLHQCSQ